MSPRGGRAPDNEYEKSPFTDGWKGIFLCRCRLYICGVGRLPSVAREWGRGGETVAATTAATALCRAAERQSQRLRSRGGETGCSRGRDARNDISDRGPSLHVLRTTRAGRQRPRALHGRGGRAELPSRADAAGWKAGPPSLADTARRKVEPSNLAWPWAQGGRVSP